MIKFRKWFRKVGGGESYELSIIGFKRMPIGWEDGKTKAVKYAYRLWIDLWLVVLKLTWTMKF